jgi:hypothetical protein
MSWLPWARAEETIPLSFLQYLHTPSGLHPVRRKEPLVALSVGCQICARLSSPRARRGRRRVCWGRTGVSRPPSGLLLGQAGAARRLLRHAARACRSGPAPLPPHGLVCPASVVAPILLPAGARGPGAGVGRAPRPVSTTLRSAHGRGAGAACRSGRERWAPVGHAGARLLGRCAVPCLPRAPVLPLCIPATERTIARRHPRRRGLGPFCRAVCCSACIRRCDVALNRSSGVADADDSDQIGAPRARRWGRVLFQGGAQGAFSWQWTYVRSGDGMRLRRVKRRLQSHTHRCGGHAGSVQSGRACFCWGATACVGERVNWLFCKVSVRA